MTDATHEGLTQTFIDTDGKKAVATFERSLYPLDSVYGAAYIFIDRCYVYLDAPDDTHVKVELRARGEIDAAGLEALAGEFANELLAQAWRREITEYNKPIIEAVAAQALAGTTGGGYGAPASDLDELEEMDFSEDSFEDPLGIAMSWEEKYGKTPAAPPVEGEPKGPPPPQGEAKEG